MKTFGKKTLAVLAGAVLCVAFVPLLMLFFASLAASQLHEWMEDDLSDALQRLVRWINNTLMETPEKTRL